MSLLSIAQIQAAAAQPILPTYLCPICGQGHAKLKLAQECASGNEQPVAAPGDLVVIANGYAWRDGLDDWLYDKRGYKFNDGKHTLRFWYVITAITQKTHRACDQDAHRLAYHVQTLGLINGHSDGHCGWTAIGTHTGFITKPPRKPPASVIEASKAMVGRTFSHLL